LQARLSGCIFLPASTRVFYPAEGKKDTPPIRRARSNTYRPINK